MPTQIKLPNLGENIESGDVLTIFVSEGDTVKANQDLLEIETDKATMPVPAPQAGKITKILISEGDTVEVGAPIMEIRSRRRRRGRFSGREAQHPQRRKARAAQSQETGRPRAGRRRRRRSRRTREEVDVVGGDEEEADARPRSRRPRSSKSTSLRQRKKTKSEPAPVATKATPRSQRQPTIATTSFPAMVTLPPRLGLPFADSPGNSASISAAFGRPALVAALRSKMFAPTFAKRTSKSPPRLPRALLRPAPPTPTTSAACESKRCRACGKPSPATWSYSYTTIPQLTNFDDADVTELEDMREQSKADYADRGIKLTAMSFVIKAIAASLKRHPMLNASVDMENNTITYKEYVNIGIAVDTERGLVVPVLRDADRKSISQIASEIEELAATVREGKFDLDLIKGGTFTISNMGAVGGTYSTPIINPPQVAILLVGRTRHGAADRRRCRRRAPDDAALDSRTTTASSTAPPPPASRTKSKASSPHRGDCSSRR